MNYIKPLPCEAFRCNVVNDQALIAERYQELLGDESKLRAASIESIYFPTSIEEVSWAVCDVRSRDSSCVVSAGRTGIAGAAAPIGVSSIISLSQLNRPICLGRDGDEFYFRVEPGMSLASLIGLLMKKDFSRFVGCTEEEQVELADILADENARFWFPVNPTETSAHIGGIVATNASGARSYRYGATREWIRALSILMPDGRLLKIRRGEVVAEGGVFLLHEADDSVTTITVPDVVLPATKATLGYPLRNDMDLIDLFIGSEGTLGIIVEVELRIARRPESMVGVLVIVPDERTALQLVILARSHERIKFDAIEYFDPATFALLKEKRQADGAGCHIPDLPNWNGCGVYFELSGTEEETEEACASMEEILDVVGLSLDDTWAAMETKEIAAQRLFRHAVPEAVNAIIGQRKIHCPGLHKVGTDMAVPDEELENMFAMYRHDLDLAGIDSVVFGHIGDNHVHVNLLPKDMAELEQARKMYLNWAKKIVEMGGAVAAEHGIGRMKKSMLEIQYPPETLKLMQQVRKAIDAHSIFAPGVLFDEI